MAIQTHYRSHVTRDLNLECANHQVMLSGWIFRRRDHGGVLFLDLRDHCGVVQLVVTEQDPCFHVAEAVPLESVVTISGVVERRPDGRINRAMETGEIEIKIEKFVVLNQANPLPFCIDSEQQHSDEMRFAHRFLDIRREHVKALLLKRSAIIAALRDEMITHQFVEIQTPILTGSSPEGARDFLVPSRKHPGKFYALPQAPQIFKQLLMTSGIDRYGQIAPCFRDEDPRADRLPHEFYQMDLEMAFVTQEDIMSLVEKMLHSVFLKFADKPQWVDAVPFTRLSYRDAMTRYGSDKPDLRNPLFAVDVTDLFKDTECQIFRQSLSQGFSIRTIAVPNLTTKSRSFLDGMVSYAQSLGAPGMAYISVTPDGLCKGPVAKFLSQQCVADLYAAAELSVKQDAVFFFLSGDDSMMNRVVDHVIRELGKRLELLRGERYAFCWITDYPMYEYKKSKLHFMHNPFSMPKCADAAAFSEPLSMEAYQYDLVCNGVEIASGAIRNHSIDLLYKVFEVVGYDREAVDRLFPALVRALRYGAPPHGGIAPGIERIIMLLTCQESIREVVWFPMTQSGEDLLMDAPSGIEINHLNELGFTYHRE